MTWRARALGLGLEVGVTLVAVAFLALWVGRQDSYYYPPLGDVLVTFGNTWLVERVGSDVVPSVVRLAIGLALGVVAGVSLGLLLGRTPRLRRAATPIVEWSRAIPPPALLPAAIVALGVGDTMKVLLIAYVCLWPVLLNAIDGAAGLDPTLRDTVRSYRIGRRDRLLRVVLPAAAPQIFAGVRLAVSISLIVMVISEMVASTNGIGHVILYAQRSFAIAEMWSGILLLGILGCAVNALVAGLERRVLRWHRAARPGAA
jgi:ABC-type nitrate/sulfonate/bicarbonate transport system permease component